MTDEKIAEAKFLLQIHHQVQNLCLNGNIQRRNRLIGNDQRGPGNQRACNGNALTLAAGKLMRIFFRRSLWQADGLQHFGHAVVALAGARAALQRNNRLGNDTLDGMARIERAIRILKNRLKALARFAQA